MRWSLHDVVHKLLITYCWLCAVAYILVPMDRCVSIVVHLLCTLHYVYLLLLAHAYTRVCKAFLIIVFSDDRLSRSISVRIIMLFARCLFWVLFVESLFWVLVVCWLAVAPWILLVLNIVWQVSGKTSLCHPDWLSLAIRGWHSSQACLLHRSFILGWD